METMNAALNYLEDPAQTPVTYTYRPPEGAPARESIEVRTLVFFPPAA